MSRTIRPDGVHTSSNSKTSAPSFRLKPVQRFTRRKMSIVLRPGPASIAQTSFVVREQVQCGEFVGPLAETKEAQEIFDAKAQSTADCGACDAEYCLICGDMYPKSGKHPCRLWDRKQIDQKVFEGLVKGKDYQVCPSKTCGRKVELLEGCNHVICPCGHSFCFICGVSAGEGHWRIAREKGGYPRYRHPSDPNAQWDNSLHLPPPSPPPIGRVVPALPVHPGLARGRTG